MAHYKERGLVRKQIEQKIADGVPLEAIAKGKWFDAAHGLTLHYSIGIKYQARKMCKERGIEWK